MINFEVRARDAMAAHGLNPRDLVMDGKLHRFSIQKNDKNGWYVFYNDGNHCCGTFGNWKEGLKVQFLGRESKEMSAVERIEFKAYREAQKRKAESALKRLQERASRIAAYTVDKMTIQGVTEHPYVIRKGIRAYAGVGMHHGSLCVPVWNGDTPVGIQFIPADGQKKFLYGTAKQGAYHVIGEVGDVIILCEGYATGASLHEATGVAVAVAFDAGNMLHVAKAWRKIHPKINIIIASDDDWKGDINTGQVKAEDARAACGGVVRHVPLGNWKERPTDFNDLHVLAGINAVRDAIFPQLPAVNYDCNDDDYDQRDYSVVADLPFKALGRFGGRCFYIPRDGYIYDFAPASHNKQVLLALAHNDYWVKEFANQGGEGIYVDAAVSSLLERTERLTFDPAQRRGRGAWIDNGRVIIHQGEKVLDVATGKSSVVMDFESTYFYPKAPSIAARQTPALPSREAVKIREMCALLPLDNPMNAYMLAGWIVCAQISGVMVWRPHIWLTGARGTGKSWAVTNIIDPLLGKNVLKVLSSTTEAGIRHTLKGDAKSVMFDEIESTGAAEKNRIQRVLELARQASSAGSGVIAKGSSSGEAIAYNIQSCFCFSSIMSGVIQSSDRSRITEIEIDSKRYGSAAQFEALEQLVMNTLTPDFCDAFYWRCVENAAIIRENAKVFSKAAGDFFKDRRAGDQIGTLLAGAFSLTSTGAMTHDKAMQWLVDREFEGAWDKSREDNEAQSDEALLLAAIMQAHIMHDGRQAIMWDLVKSCATHSIDNTESKRSTLMSYGVRVDFGNVIIANKCENMRKLLRDTPFSENWGKMLQRLPNAVKSDGMVRFGGFTSRSTIISMDVSE